MTNTTAFAPVSGQEFTSVYTESDRFGETTYVCNSTSITSVSDAAEARALRLLAAHGLVPSVEALAQTA